MVFLEALHSLGGKIFRSTGPEPQELYEPGALRTRAHRTGFVHVVYGRNSLDWLEGEQPGPPCYIGGIHALPVSGWLVVCC